MRAALAARRGRTGANSGTTHRDFSLERSLAYIDAVFSEYVRYSGRSREALQGIRVLEVGPGDNYGVALRFLAAGAAEVTCIDRFRPWRDPGKEARIYRGLLDSLPPAERQRAAEAVSFNGAQTVMDTAQFRAI